MKFRDKAIAFVLLSVMAIYAVFNYVVLPANQDLDEMKEKKKKVEFMVSDIDPLLKETEEKQSQKDILYEKYDLIRCSRAFNTATSEEFLVYIGSSAEKNNVKLTGFSDLGTTFEDGVYKAYYDIELSGGHFSITNVIQDLDRMGIVFSVGSASFRQDKEYDYLKRFFDFESNLTWYTESEEENENTSKDKTDVPSEQKNSESGVDKDSGKTSQSDNKESIITPDNGSIEDRLEELLKMSSTNNGYVITPLTNTTVTSKTQNTNEMRLAFTVCLVMFNEPSEETSFINVEKSDSTEETGEDDGVF